MVLEVAVVADDDDAVATIDEFGTKLTVAGGLGRFIVHRAVAEDAGVRTVKEVRDAPRRRSSSSQVILSRRRQRTLGWSRSGRSSLFVGSKRVTIAVHRMYLTG